MNYENEGIKVYRTAEEDARAHTHCAIENLVYEYGDELEEMTEDEFVEKVEEYMNNDYYVIGYYECRVRFEAFEDVDVFQAIKELKEEWDWDVDNWESLYNSYMYKVISDEGLVRDVLENDLQFRGVKFIDDVEESEFYEV